MQKYFLTCLICLIPLFGCGPSGPARPPGMPKLVPLKLTVTQEGTPLEGAFVTLYPTDGAPWSSAGDTNAQGVVPLYTRGQFEGTAPGKYKVTVAKTETTPLEFSGDPEKDPEGYRKAEAQRKSFNLVDPVFSKESTTTLELTVETGKLAETLDVGKAVKAPIK